MARGLGEADVARNDGPENLATEMVEQLTRNLLVEIASWVVHGAQKPFDDEPRVDTRAHPFDRGAKSAQTFKGVVFTLDRDENAVGRDERVEGQNVQARGAIDQDPREPFAQGCQRLGEPPLGPPLARHDDFSGRQIGMRGQKAETQGTRLHFVEETGDRPTTDEDVVDGRIEASPVDSDPCRGVGLGVEIDEKNRQTVTRQGGREVDGGRRFADTPFLVGDSNDGAHVDRPVEGEGFDRTTVSRKSSLRPKASGKRGAKTGRHVGDKASISVRPRRPLRRCQTVAS